MKYRTNNLNKKIELQESIKVSDGIGGYIIKWIKIKNIWAKVELISNISNKNFDILELKATHLIVVRYLNSINNNMRFVYKNIIYNIKYINNLDNYFTEVICEEDNKIE